jgi:NADH-quinone oxidoreductase subunit L
MPVTFIIFLITACSITGIPPFNGFFSKELVYEGALERHWIFYALAVAGSFLTAISFLKLGHAAYLGKPGKATSQAKESSPMLLIPMGILALACLFFGVANQLPLQQFIQPVLVQAGLGQEPAGHEMGGAVINPLLLTVSLAVLVLAFLNHLFGFLRTKSGLLAEDHLYRAPVLTIIYAWAEKRYFDPYHVGRYVIQALARLLFKLERVIDWIVTRTPVILARWLGKMLQKLQNGSYSLYIILALGGALIMLLNLILNLKG